MLVDVHAHLFKEYYEDIGQIVENAKNYTVDIIINNATNLTNCQEVILTANEFENVYAAIGIHPEDVDSVEEGYLIELEKLARENKKVVAIGEIGLDYHWTKDNKEKQKEILLDQILLAEKLDLPLIIHSRDAVGDIIELLKENKQHLKKYGIIHCFGGSDQSAKILLDLGFSFSFGGVATFNNAEKVVKVIESLPLDRIVLETDCPYMTPVPHRKEKNEPKFVVNIAERIAQIKGVSVEEIAKITTENAKRIFNI